VSPKQVLHDDSAVYG